MSKKTRKTRVRGSVALISSLLIASAGIRLLTSAEAALAEIEGGDGLFSQAVTAVSNSATQEHDRTAMQSLLDALRNREAAIKVREHNIEMRRKALDVAQVEIERRLDALEAAEKRLGATLTLANTASEDDIARLTTVYENMKPKDAAALFETMEPEFAAGFIARMLPGSAAKVMSGLDPKVAYTISVILAGRNASAPKS
jgi:flagellar motility protein MotE (MotC chaperone)